MKQTIEPINLVKQIYQQNTLQQSILVDASSAILLFKTKLFENLLQYYQVKVSASVFKEITKAGYPGADYFADCKEQGLLAVDQLDPIEKKKDISFLDQGERETICLYLQGTAKFIITDDGPAARYCKSNRIPFINALLLPRILFANQIISENLYHKQMDSLISLGRYSEQVIDFAQNCSPRELNYFKP